MRGGTADRGDMVRVDVFQKMSPRGARWYYLVPVYPHEVVERDQPPNRAVQSGNADKWPVIDNTFDFLWSVYHMSLIELTKSDGETILGYFRNLDRNTGALTISVISDSTKTRKGIGARTLVDFKKLVVDRLGRTSKVEREVRTWRGKACT